MVSVASYFAFSLSGARDIASGIVNKMKLEAAQAAIHTIPSINEFWAGT